MKLLGKYFLVALFACFLISCSIQNNTSNSKSGEVNYSSYADIFQILKTHPYVGIGNGYGEEKVYVKTNFPHATHGSPLGLGPLFVVDGARVGTDFGAISSIPPSNIESIDVLRELGQCSKYGREGDNGVIVITTKTEPLPY